MLNYFLQRKKLNNKFRFELFLAQFSTPCWLQLRSFIDNFKGSKRKQKNKISGRQLRCLDGLKEKTILDLLQKNNNQHVDFCKFKAMCDEHKSKSSSVYVYTITFLILKIIAIFVMVEIHHTK